MIRDIKDILIKAVDDGASDILIVAGFPLSYKVNGSMVYDENGKLTPDDTGHLIRGIYDLTDNRNINKLLDSGDDDFSFSVKQLGRFRCNAYKQRGSIAAVIRIVSFELPDPAKFNVPQEVLDLTSRQRGLILVTGPTGSGKSTTLACLINKINHERKGHIITIEDPIEFLHPHLECIVSQREIALDTGGYNEALRATLRQSPDVILLGEMRDYETIHTAITAAETGELVLSTLHTMGAAKTVDRIIDVFPSNQQQQIRVQLSMVLQAVVSQQLVPTVDGKLVAAFEIMLMTPAIQTMVRESKAHQIDNVIYSNAALGMRTMDADLIRLYNEGRISRDTAIAYSINPDITEKKLTK